MKLDALIEVLEELQPIELEGVALLRERRLQTGNWFPNDHIPPDVLLRCTLEFMRYGDSCLAVIDRLERNADPVPLSLPLVEYSL